ncbi:hypothetical protein BDZ45DRAFT_280328 [Acephala macrosclerotiorum]|nr:hypothetical protein BDZ45DRAFT_280328 [Acephala macrosclerotiorum]
MVLKYRSLGTMEKRTWDRLRFGLKELNTIRQKLTYHTAQIKLFLSNLMMGSIGRIETLLEEFVKEIRSGKRAPTMLSIEQGGDEAVIGWKRLECDLSDSGVPFEDIDRHRDDIEEYLAQLTTHLVLNSVGSTAGLDAGSCSDGLGIEPVLEDNWDSISQRMASKEDSAAQTEHLNDEKSDMVPLVTERRAENDPEELSSRGLSPQV